MINQIDQGTDLNSKYPVPNQEKFDKLVEELHSVSWDGNSQSDLRRFMYIIGQINNYWIKQDKPHSTFIPNVQWNSIMINDLLGI